MSLIPLLLGSGTGNAITNGGGGDGDSGSRSIPISVGFDIERYMPMYWVPRWFEAYYDNDSLLKKIYFLSLYYYAGYLKQITKDRTFPVFFGEIGADRYLFIAKYHYPKTHIPSITLTVSGTDTTVIFKDSMGSLLYEEITPAYLREDDLLYFKNLDIRSVAVSATSGLIDLNSAFTQEAIDTDSPLIIENQWGDLNIIDQSSNVYFASSGQVLVPFNGTYTLYYRSSLRYQSLINGTSYITIDDEVIPLKVIYTKNIWDNFIELLSTKRNKHETNYKLKARCQHLTIAKRPNQKMAAALGLTTGISWYTSGAAVSLSGYNDWQFQGYARSFYINEVPHKDGDNFLLTYSPTGHVQVFVDGNKVLEDSYVVSGSYIIASSGLIKNTKEKTLNAVYKHQNIHDLDYPESASILADTPDGLLYRGILIKDDIVVETTTKRIAENDWKWNRELGTLIGSAEFDF